MRTESKWEIYFDKSQQYNYYCRSQLKNTMQNTIQSLRKYKVWSWGKCDSYKCTVIIPDEIFLFLALKLTSPIARGRLSDEYSSLSEQERSDWPLFYPAVISRHLITSLSPSLSISHSQMVVLSSPLCLSDSSITERRQFIDYKNMRKDCQLAEMDWKTCPDNLYLYEIIYFISYNLSSKFLKNAVSKFED